MLACSDSGPSTASCRGVQYGTAERWKRPAMAKLTGAHDATAFGADCQSSPEACLYLNVYAPKAALGKGAELPVMVWIRASPRCPLYPPAHRGATRAGLSWIVVSVRRRRVLRRIHARFRRDAAGGGLPGRGGRDRRHDLGHGRVPPERLVRLPPLSPHSPPPPPPPARRRQRCSGPTTAAGLVLTLLLLLAVASSAARRYDRATRSAQPATTACRTSASPCSGSPRTSPPSVATAARS